MPLELQLLSRLLKELSPPVPCLRAVHVLPRWVVVQCERCAMASAFQPRAAEHSLRAGADFQGLRGWAVPEIVHRFAHSRCPRELALVEACLNASLPPPPGLCEGNALELFGQRLAQCPSCFIGHFTQAEVWRARGWPVTIVELQPRPGDILWQDAKAALLEAEIVFITGLTLLNGTFLEVLNRTPHARYRVLLGPTVPCSRLFFEYGIHLIGSTFISDPRRVLDCLRPGGAGLGGAPAGAFRKVALTNREELLCGLSLAPGGGTAGGCKLSAAAQ